MEDLRTDRCAHKLGGAGRGTACKPWNARGEYEGEHGTAGTEKSASDDLQGGSARIPDAIGQ